MGRIDERQPHMRRRSSQSAFVHVRNTYNGPGLLLLRHCLHKGRDLLKFHQELPEECTPEVILPALLAQKVRTVLILLP